MSVVLTRNQYSKALHHAPNGRQSICRLVMCALQSHFVLCALLKRSNNKNSPKIIKEYVKILEYYALYEKDEMHLHRYDTISDISCVTYERVT